MLVTLKSFKAFKFLILIDSPELDSHIACTTGKHLTCRMEINIIDHAGVLSQILLAFSCFVVPYLDSCIFARSGNLRVDRVELAFGNFGSVSF